MAMKEWQKTDNLGNRAYTCGHCGMATGSNLGYWKHAGRTSERIADGFPHPRAAAIFLCMRCEKPTYFEDGNDASQVPSPPFGNEVMHLPDTIKAVYSEARNCMLVAAYTSAALMCRKILMNVAVNIGADENKPFAYYIDYFKANNYIPPKGEKWFDYIRQKGNDGTHEIVQLTREDAEHVIKFSETILTLVYDFPNRI